MLTNSALVFFIPSRSLATPPSAAPPIDSAIPDRKSTRLNSSHSQISYAVLCLKKNTTPPCRSAGGSCPWRRRRRGGRRRSWPVWRRGNRLRDREQPSAPHLGRRNPTPPSSSYS